MMADQAEMLDPLPQLALAELEGNIFLPIKTRPVREGLCVILSVERLLMRCDLEPLMFLLFKVMNRNCR